MALCQSCKKVYTFGGPYCAKCTEKKSKIAKDLLSPKKNMSAEEEAAVKERDRAWDNQWDKQGAAEQEYYNKKRRESKTKKEHRLLKVDSFEQYMEFRDQQKR